MGHKMVVSFLCISYFINLIAMDYFKIVPLDVLGEIIIFSTADLKKVKLLKRLRALRTLDKRSKAAIDKQIATKKDLKEIEANYQKYTRELCTELDKENLKIDWKKVQELVQNGADPNVQGKNKKTAVQCLLTMDAQIMEHEMGKCINVLIREGADYDLQGQKRYVPLYSCIQNKNELVMSILMNGNEKTDQPILGKTLQHSAIWWGEKLTVQHLIEAQIDVNIRDEKNQTALHLAATGDDNLADVLLEAGADVNLQDDDGATPLHRAAACGHPTIVKKLLEKKANPKIKNNQEQTPLDIAKMHCQKETIDQFPLQKYVKVLELLTDSESPDLKRRKVDE